MVMSRCRAVLHKPIQVVPLSYAVALAQQAAVDLCVLAPRTVAKAVPWHYPVVHLQLAPRVAFRFSQVLHLAAVAV